MSNILIIKLGSLGDIVQISGVLRDIKAAHKDKKIFMLTTMPYVELLSMCPYLDAILIDKRLSRLNIFYLIKLRQMLNKYKFTHVFDLQNSARTDFYRKFIFNVKNWSSTKTIVSKVGKMDSKVKESVLHRFKFQLDNSEVKSNFTLKPDFSWSIINIDKIINKYFGKKFILLFPFCSPKLKHKIWPYFNDLIEIIKLKHKNFEIVIAPGPNEIDQSKKINAIPIMNNNKPLKINELSGLIKKSSYVIGNDTGPAHMAAHLGSKGKVLFGHHTTAEKVSIETDNFKPISVKNLNDLSALSVYEMIKNDLDLIN
tara:strand:- start:3038 stop:3976 length:939 start_codon:yes stop_codon:yes gene_type:complete